MPLHLKTGLGRRSNQGVNSTLKYFSCISDMEEFIKGLQALIFTQSPTLQLCWKFHPQVASKLSQTITTCLLYSVSMVYSYNFVSFKQRGYKRWSLFICPEQTQPQMLCNIVWRRENLYFFFQTCKMSVLQFKEYIFLLLYMVL